MSGGGATPTESGGGAMSGGGATQTKSGGGAVSGGGARTTNQHKAVTPSAPRDAFKTHFVRFGIRVS